MCVRGGSAKHVCYHSNCYQLQDQKSVMKSKPDFLALLREPGCFQSSEVVHSHF